MIFRRCRRKKVGVGDAGDTAAAAISVLMAAKATITRPRRRMGPPGDAPPAWRLRSRRKARRYCVTNWTLSMCSSTGQTRVPLFEWTCHCNPVIWLAVTTAELAGLLNAVNRVVNVVAVAVAAVRAAAGYRSHGVA